MTHWADMQTALPGPVHLFETTERTECVKFVPQTNTKGFVHLVLNIHSSVEIHSCKCQWRIGPCIGIRRPHTSARVTVKPTTALWVGWQTGSNFTRKFREIILSYCKCMHGFIHIKLFSTDKKCDVRELHRSSCVLTSPEYNWIHVTENLLHIEYIKMYDRQSLNVLAAWGRLLIDFSFDCVHFFWF